MLQGEFVDSLRAQLAEKDARIELLERLLAERDARLTERDEEIGRLRRRMRALGGAGQKCRGRPRWARQLSRREAWKLESRRPAVP